MRARVPDQWALQEGFLSKRHVENVTRDISRAEISESD